ncbi:MAG TPA: sigma-54 dependent transcriptional regulator [Pyrinomonadaceae bacterium]|nr:sigma-54 dependent transcriptional regulator [Pyrinomonadaceae bacterium]
MKPAKILLLDLNSASDSGGVLRGIVESHTGPCDFEFARATFGGGPRAGELLLAVTAEQPDVIILVASGESRECARQLLQAVGGERMPAPVLVADEQGESEWLRLGAAGFLSLPPAAEDVLPRVGRLLEQFAHRERRAQALQEKLGTTLLVGESRSFLKEVNKIPLLAKCNASILISGETGTGKEVCARAIHYLGRWASKPFVPVNCGAIPAELVENELFGHERGAFTGARSTQVGLIQEADGGTLFLDEVDCLPLLSQVKLLRFLQEKEYRPLGSTKTCRADVRVIAAMNADPEEAIRVGNLRRDLYYRLNVIPLALPPLRERRGDIPLLARHFLAKYAAEFDKRVTDFSPEAMQLLVSYDWPGNVRELEHVVVRSIVLTAGDVISGADIALAPRASASADESFKRAKNRIVAEFEKSYVERALLLSHGNISKAARAAQKSRRAFWELIRKHRIDVNGLKPHAP